MGSHLKSNLAVASKYEAFYTSGKIQTSHDGEYMFCGCGNKVYVLNINTGQKEQVIGQDEDPDVTSFVLSPDDKFLVVALQNLLFKQWDWKENTLIRSWKAIHSAPVLTMAFDCTSTLLATGSSDSTIKVWDIVKQYCTHNLRGHQGVVTVVKFHPDISKLQLFTAAEDYKIRLWDLQTSTCLTVMDKHYSTITSLEFVENGTQLVSAGRDSVLILWNLSSKEAVKTIPVYEAIESVVVLPDTQTFPDLEINDSGTYCMTAGSKGLLRIWNLASGKCVHNQLTDVAVVKQSKSDEHDQAIIQAFHLPERDLVAVVTFDHNIVFYQLGDLALHKQFSGYSDEILDIGYLGQDDSHIVVATNSEQIKIFELATWNCQILRGHTEIVLCIDTLRKADLFASSSKDNTIRLWKFDPESHKTECVGIGYGHTNAVGAVTMSRYTASFIVSGGKDYTVKLWSIPNTFTPGEPVHLHATATEKAHDKDINSIVVSPNDKLIATGSQDKTAKLWNASNLSLVGVMRGHRRGIWCVQFSPVDQCLATASADGIIKIWSLSDYSCVKTFEGHDASVLQVDFVSRGMQLLSSGSDGLIKLWTIKTNECVKTFDEHEDKAWAMAVSKKEDFVITGGADSAIIVWKDVTESEFQEERAKEEEVILKEQELSNLLQQKKYLKAIGLAITLERPFRVLNIIKEISAEADHTEQLTSTIQRLRMDQIDAILRFSVQWNMNSRHCHVAQLVISVILKSYPPETLLQLSNIKATLEGLLPYTERHFQRMNRLLQNSTFIDYTWQCMKLTDVASSEEMEAMESETIMTENLGNHSEELSNSDAMEKTTSTVTAKEDKENNENGNSDIEVDKQTVVENVKESAKKRKKKTIKGSKDDGSQQELIENSNSRKVKRRKSSSK